MSQEQVSGLAILSIENKHASELDVANIVETFVQQKRTSERFKPYSAYCDIYRLGNRNDCS